MVQIKNLGAKLLVLHIISDLQIGGAELMLYRLIKSDCGDDGNVKINYAVVSLGGTGPVGEWLIEHGIPVYALNIKRIFNAPMGLFKLYKIIDHLKPDIVHTWMYHADLLGGIAARLNNRLLVWCVRATNVSAGWSKGTILLRHICALFSYWLPEKIIFAAEASRSEHIKIGYSASKCLVIANGFDVVELNNLAPNRDVSRGALNIGADNIVIGTVGRFNEVKDYPNFIEALGIVGRSFTNIHILMVGKDLDFNNLYLTNLISLAGMNGRVTLLGNRLDIPACLAAMDIFCLSSLDEGFPNVVGEAMSLSIPCIVTDVGDAAEIVGDTGIIVSKANSSALASALLRLINLSQKQRDQMGVLAKKRIENLYTLEQSRRKFINTYTEIVKNNGMNL
jgi:glycosyltransferase involved in cell wall biosynthesis